jgi:hypothetical protein
MLMNKVMIAAFLLGLSSLGWMQDRRRPVVPLGAGEMVLEWTPGKEAVVRITAESEEGLECVQILRPDGRKLVDVDARILPPDGRRLVGLDAQDRLQSNLGGFEIELREPSLERLFRNYAEGLYDIRADTVGGKQALGKAHLSFDLPPAPRIVYPEPGQLVPSSNLTVFWLADRGAAGYLLQVEQGEDDGLRVKLPPEQSSFRVPNGLLAPGTETSLEVVAIGANGNRTLVEVLFETRP